MSLDTTKWWTPFSNLLKKEKVQLDNQCAYTDVAITMDSTQEQFNI